MKLEHDPAHTPAGPYNEGGAASDGGSSDNGEGSLGIDDDGEDEQTRAGPEAKKRSPRVLKTEEEKAAVRARTAAAFQAVSWLYRFLWRNHAYRTC